ncbi:MAG: heavy-metal-associated domain-containing protein [Myxococcota bacterium]
MSPFPLRTLSLRVASMPPPAREGRSKGLMAASAALGLALGAAGGQVACSQPVQPAATETATATTTVQLAVEGMTCGDCEQAINAAVSKLPGVVRCVASHVDKVARIELAAAAPTSPAVIADTVRKLGYTVTLP